MLIKQILVHGRLRSIKYSIIVAVILGLMQTAFGDATKAMDYTAADSAVPHGGVAVLPALSPDSDVHSQLQVDGLTWSAIDVAGEPFGHALRGVVSRAPTNAYDLQFSSSTTAAVRKGDQLLAVFRVKGRGQEVPDAVATFVFEQDGGEWEKSVVFEFSVGSEWRTFYVPFKSLDTYPQGRAHVTIQLGSALQTVDIGWIQVLNYGANPPANLPVTHFDYPGRSLDAPWRKAAEQRIEKYRKADLVINVVDADGKPVAADVSIRMTRHAFKFGTETSFRSLVTDQGPEHTEYRRQLLRLFNYATPGNALKWPMYERYGAEADGTVDWLIAHGMTVRGHNMVWPSWKPWYLPAWLKEGYDSRTADPAQGPTVAKQWLASRVDERIQSAGKHFAGRVTDWDVVNEPYAEHDLLDILGPNTLAGWYRSAHKADPAARLFVNDYSILEGGGNDTRHQDSYFQTIKSLKDAGAPLDGIGIQGHWGWLPTGPERMLQILDRFATFGLPIQITEFDMNITDEQLQADFTRDLLTTVFSHPSVDAFIMWGFWEKAHWLPNGAMYRADWTPKPNGKVFEDLVLNKWWTHLDSKTDANGRLTCRVFRGDHSVTATVNGKTFEQMIDVDNPSEPTSLTIVVK